jgi:uncharacterized protein YjbJ (UPF0337 family)
MERPTHHGVSTGPVRTTIVRTTAEIARLADATHAIGNVEHLHSLHVQPGLSRRTNMDKDRVAGAAKQAKGAVKEAAGKIMGDSKTEAEGKADKAEGKVQNAIGGAKDAIREAAKQD